MQYLSTSYIFARGFDGSLGGSSWRYPSLTRSVNMWLMGQDNGVNSFLTFLGWGEQRPHLSVLSGGGMICGIKKLL